MITTYGRELLIVLLVVLAWMQNSRMEYYKEELSKVKTENIRLKEISKENTTSTETSIETRPDGTTIKTQKNTNTQKQTETNSKIKNESTEYSKVEKSSIANYQASVLYPVNDFTETLKLKKFTFDAGIRLFGLPAFGVIQYRNREISIGGRVEW